MSDVEHVPASLRDGLRWESQGDICTGCSDPEMGRWVPVSFCTEASVCDELVGVYYTVDGDRRVEEFYADPVFDTYRRP